MITVAMPARFLDQHVGGNTTYARRLASGLSDRGISVSKIPLGKNAVTTALNETRAARTKPQSGDYVTHYVADTGPVLRTVGPSLLTVHGVASRWISTARTGWQERVWRSRVRRAIACTNQLITISESSADDIADVFDVDRHRIRVVAHGVDTAKFSEVAQLSEVTRALVPSSYALYLGNIEPRKNLIALVRAFETAEVKALGIPLVIAGKPAWNAKASMEAILGSDSTIYLEFVSDSDRAALMQGCSLFVFPSLYEGFGFPVLEALSAGAPVLCSSKGSLSEVAGPSMRIESLDRDGIASSVSAAMSDGLWMARCRSDGLDWASTFSWETSVDNHVEIYRGLLT